MELALLIGKYLFVALIYLFVGVVYRGLMAGLKAESGTESRPAPRQVRREVRVRTPEPKPVERPAPTSSAARAAASASSVAEALAEEPSPPPPAAPVSAPVSAPVTRGAGGGPRLVVIRSSAANLAVGREFPLLAAATLGRAEHNLICLPEQYVSTQHALIFMKEGRRVLRDRGSTNGTFVNGQRVTGDVVLRDGDEITLGTTTLRYTEPGPG